MIVRTEYSFRRAFGTVEAALERLPKGGIIADDGTWGHVAWHKAAKAAKKMSGLGVRLRISEAEEGKSDWREVIVVPTSALGLRDLYGLVTIANKQFHHWPRLRPSQLDGDGDWLLIAAPGKSGDAPPLPPGILKPFVPGVMLGADLAFSDNFYPAPEDRRPWSFALGQLAYTSNAPAHIMLPSELRASGAQNLGEDLLERCSGVAPPKAENIRYPVKDAMRELEALCSAEMVRRGLRGKAVYEERYAREMALVAEKGFADYFLVIADMIAWAKKRMLVGPGRGSSAGSLLCWLMRVTEVDPIVHGLLFERFIDANRFDLPDIDIDFPDSGRASVLEYLAEKYGQAQVAHIGTVMKYKPKSALTDVAKQLRIPDWELKGLKDTIIERSSGDSRANDCLRDTVEASPVGRELLTKYPDLDVAFELEGKCRQTGTHAAGMIIANAPVEEFCAIGRERVAQIDKKAATDLNILKIDALGLRNLSILDTACELVGMNREALYGIPLDDPAVFQIFNRRRFTGIFQFEGYALQSLASQITFREFNDIAALTALARPGPLGGGEATRWVERHEGREAATPPHPAIADITAETFGTILYQEQVMVVTRKLGNFSWADTAAIRKLMSDRKGEESFRKFEALFMKGCAENGVPLEGATRIWKAINSFGCLSGDTIIELPCANQHSPKSITLKELYNNGGLAKIAEAKSNRLLQAGRSAKLWCWRESENRIAPEKLIEVTESGMKETFTIELEDGKMLRATASHRFLVTNGWLQLSKLKAGMGIAVLGAAFPSKKFKGVGSGAHNHKGELQSILFVERCEVLKQRYKRCQKCKKAPYEETHHIDKNRKNNEWSNLLPVCRKCHKSFHRAEQGWRYKKGKQLAYSKIKSIKRHGVEMTYDIAMPSPNNNFVANGIVVHNSWAFNKSHAVVYGLVSYWCGYMKARHPLEFACACLRHNRGDDAVLLYLRELTRDGIEYIPFDPELSAEDWAVVDGKLIGGLLGIPGIGEKTAKAIINRRANGVALTDGQKKLLARESVYTSAFPTRKKFGHIYANPGAAGIRLAPLREIAEADGHVVIIGKLLKKATRDMNDDRFLEKRKGVKLTGDALTMLIMHVGDDSGRVICIVDRFKFKDYGAKIADEGVVGKTWLMIRGRVNDAKFMIVNVEAVRWLE